MPERQTLRMPGEDEAQELAVRILGWLVRDPDMMGRFLALSGIEAQAIRQAAQEPGFHAGLTGFVMDHEPTLMRFCEEEGMKPEFVAACHQRLAGPEDQTWM